MKKISYWKAVLFTAVCLWGAVFGMKLQTVTVQAAIEPTIASGVIVEGKDLGGMTKVQARNYIESYVYKILEDGTLFTMQYEDLAELRPNGAVLGGSWSNPEILEEMMQYGNKGHVVKRYKERKALEREPVSYEVEIAFAEDAIASYIEANFTGYNQEVKDYYLTRKNKKFEIVEGQVGYELDVQTSAQKTADFLNKSWDRKAVVFPLEVTVVEPKGSVEELSLVTDIIGTFTSSFAGGTEAKVTNISNGSVLINGITMYPDEDFSFDAYAAPYTVANGYAMGQSYSGGKLVNDVGGGICQVSSTLYNAVLRAELEITMRYNHSMIVGYVPISSDATLAETAGKDFRFKNNQDTPIYIESYLTKDNTLVVNVYGKETRPSNRTVDYESEILEVINPGPDVIHVNGSLPVGEIQVSSAYTGYKAKLWKVVKVDGVEKSRELVNSSNYRAVARMATVGMQTNDPAILERMNAAVATGNIDHVQNVITAIMAPPEYEEY